MCKFTIISHQAFNVHFQYPIPYCYSKPFVLLAVKRNTADHKYSFTHVYLAFPSSSSTIRWMCTPKRSAIGHNLSNVPVNLFVGHVTGSTTGFPNKEKTNKIVIFWFQPIIHLAPIIILSCIFKTIYGIWTLTASYCHGNMLVHIWLITIF